MESAKSLQQELVNETGSLLAGLTHDRLQDISRKSLVDLVTYFAKSLLGGRSLVNVVGSLLEDLHRPQLVEISRQLTLTEIKNYVLECWWRKPGLEGVAEFVRCPNAHRLQELHSQKQPAILAFWHLGARFSLGPGLRRIGVPALIFAKPPQILPLGELDRLAASLPGLGYFVLTKQPGNHAVALKRAVEHLQKGGLVGIGVDGAHGENMMEAPFLGRRIQLGRGAAVLARLTGTPIIPVVLAWSSTDLTIEFQIHEPIARPEVSTQDGDTFDHTLTRAIARWFDDFARSSPGQLRLHRLRSLLNAARFTAVGPASVAARPSTPDNRPRPRQAE